MFEPPGQLLARRFFLEIPGDWEPATRGVGVSDAHQACV